MRGSAIAATSDLRRMAASRPTAGRLHLNQQQPPAGERRRPANFRHAHRGHFARHVDGHVEHRKGLEGQFGRIHVLAGANAQRFRHSARRRQ